MSNEQNKAAKKDIFDEALLDAVFGERELQGRRPVSELPNKKKNLLPEDYEPCVTRRGTRNYTARDGDWDSADAVQRFQEMDETQHDATAGAEQTDFATMATTENPAASADEAPAHHNSTAGEKIAQAKEPSGLFVNNDDDDGDVFGNTNESGDVKNQARDSSWSPPIEEKPAKGKGKKIKTTPGTKKPKKEPVEKQKMALNATAVQKTRQEKDFNKRIRDNICNFSEPDRIKYATMFEPANGLIDGLQDFMEVNRLQMSWKEYLHGRSGGKQGLKDGTLQSMPLPAGFSWAEKSKWQNENTVTTKGDMEHVLRGSMSEYLAKLKAFMVDKRRIHDDEGEKAKTKVAEMQANATGQQMEINDLRRKLAAVNNEKTHLTLKIKEHEQREESNTGVHKDELVKAQQLLDARQKDITNLHTVLERIKEANAAFSKRNKELEQSLMEKEVQIKELKKVEKSLTKFKEFNKTAWIEFVNDKKQKIEDAKAQMQARQQEAADLKAQRAKDEQDRADARDREEKARIKKENDEDEALAELQRQANAQLEDLADLDAMTDGANDPYSNFGLSYNLEATEREIQNGLDDLEAAIKGLTEGVFEGGILYEFARSDRRLFNQWKKTRESEINNELAALNEQMRALKIELKEKKEELVDLLSIDLDDPPWEGESDGEAGDEQDSDESDDSGMMDLDA